MLLHLNRFEYKTKIINFIKNSDNLFKNKKIIKKKRKKNSDQSCVQFCGAHLNLIIGHWWPIIA